MPWFGKHGNAHGRGNGGFIGVTGVSGLAISGVPGPATQGVAYNFTPSVFGGVLPLTFTLLSGAIPAGTSLSSSTGAVSGPSTTVGTASGVIRVTDSAGTPVHQDLAFSITTSAALVLTNAPATTATVGSPYSYTPTTTGGRAPITWAISNKPLWATFDTSTGGTTGTPTGAETDVAINITGTDADGRVVATGAFTITVSAPVSSDFSFPLLYMGYL
jgi:hypothetical protein